MSRLALCIALLSGCAATAAPTPPPAAPPPASAAPEVSAAPRQSQGDAAEPGADAASTSSGSSASESAATENAKSEGDGIRSASRPPAELITAPNVLFVFNFTESEVGASARERCEGETNGPAEFRACLDKARGKVPVESIRFVKDASGALWWLTYNRYKGNLLKWHKVQFSPGPETADSITLNLIGKDKGIAPMARVPRSLSIALPNDYSIVVQDPEFGAMTYDAKIGLMESNQP